MQRLIIVIAACALSACAAPGYEQYLAAQQGIATARSNADIARYDALANIASKGDSAASVAAAMALAMGGNTPQPVIAAPQNELLQWAGVLVPALTQAYAIGQSANVAINASNNAARSAEATTAGFVGMAGKIQAPVIAPTVLPQANVVVGFDPHTGAERWTAGAHLARGPALITNGRAIVAGTDGKTEVRDVMSGALTCTMTRGMGHDRAGPASDGRMLYFVDRAGMLERIAIDRLLGCRGKGLTPA